MLRCHVIKVLLVIGLSIVGDVPEIINSNDSFLKANQDGLQSVFHLNDSIIILINLTGLLQALECFFEVLLLLVNNGHININIDLVDIGSQQSLRINIHNIIKILMNLFDHFQGFIKLL